MRILLICHEPDGGDVTTHVLRLARSLVERGHGVVVASPQDSWLLQQCRSCAIHHEAVPLRGGADLGSCARLLGLVRKLDIEVVHGHGDRSSLYATLVASLVRKPVVTTAFSSSRSIPYGLAHRIITVSESLRRELLAHRWLAGRIDVVYDGVPPPPPTLLAQRAARREALGLQPSDVAIAMVGSRDTLAEQRLWIHTIGRLRQTHPGVHLFIEERRELEALLVAMDIFALPRRREGTSLALFEALAFGLPVVASIGPGTSEIVRHGETGLLFARGDGSMLAAMLVLLVEDPGWRASLGANARRCHRESFTLQRMVTETETIYRALVA
jgi:glycosyltransferase involved in cell wall biosynthesis